MDQAATQRLECLHLAMEYSHSLEELLENALALSRFVQTGNIPTHPDDGEPAEAPEAEIVTGVDWDRYKNGGDVA